MIRTEGDATFAAFPEAIAAVAAAAEAQKGLTGEVWPDGVAIRVRMDSTAARPIGPAMTTAVSTSTGRRESLPSDMAVR